MSASLTRRGPSAQGPTEGLLPSAAHREARDGYGGASGYLRSRHGELEPVCVSSSLSSLSAELQSTGTGRHPSRRAPTSPRGPRAPG